MSFPRPAIGKQGSIRPPAILVGLAAALAVVAAPVATLAGEGVGSLRPVGFGRPRLARGVFLVASPHLRDPNFAEAVILLVGHDGDGSIGLIINRRTEVDLTTALPDVEELRGIKGRLFLGGPVARDRVILLVRSSLPPESSLRVVDDVFVTTSANVLRQMVSKTRSVEDLHVYAGYAGWAPGQLEAEVASGDWHVTMGDGRTVFETPAQQIWPSMMGRLEGEWAQRGGSPGLVQAIRTDRQLELVENVGADQAQTRQRAHHDVEIVHLLVADLEPL